jgi:hypothetical protein
MDRDLYQKVLVDLVLPDIKKKILVNTNSILQQDGAKSHLQEDDEVFKAKVTELFGNPNAVKLYSTGTVSRPECEQPWLLQLFTVKILQTFPKNSIELIERVEDVYKKYPLESLNKIRLTIQSVMNRIISTVKILQDISKNSIGLCKMVEHAYQNDPL